MLYIKIEVMPPEEQANVGQDQSFVMTADTWHPCNWDGTKPSFVSAGSIVTDSVSKLDPSGHFLVPILLYQEDSAIRVSVYRTLEHAQQKNNKKHLVWQQTYDYMLPEPHFPKPAPSPYWRQLTGLVGTWTKNLKELMAEKWHVDPTWKSMPVMIEENAAKDPKKRTPVASCIRIDVDKVVVDGTAKGQEAHPMSLYVDRIYRLQKFMLILDRSKFPWLKDA
jgi:hypothetical protein